MEAPDSLGRLLWGQRSSAVTLTAVWSVFVEALHAAHRTETAPVTQFDKSAEHKLNM